MCSENDELVKFASLAPNSDEEGDKKIKPHRLVVVYDFVDDDNSITVGPLPWAVGDLALDRQG